MTLCFATNNLHKLEEVRRALAGGQIEILSLSDINSSDELPETGETLEANSFEKADHLFRKYNLPCFADDTGLEVDALDGAPGVYSARYAGSQRNSDDNIKRLLKNLEGIELRTARFRTVISLIGIETIPLVFEGVVNGIIASERKGMGGFGYDSIFVPEGYNRTFAEMTIDEKNTLSHRALAVAKLVNYLKMTMTTK